MQLSEIEQTIERDLNYFENLNDFNKEIIYADMDKTHDSEADSCQELNFD